MIVLADIPGQLIFLIIAAAIGVVNWWLEQQKKKANPPGDDREKPRTFPKIEGGAGGESEQERLKRFLEALGVPQQPGGGQPPRQQPPPPRPRAHEAPRPLSPRPAPAQPQPRRREMAPMPRQIPPVPRAVTRRPPPIAARKPPVEQDEMGYEGGGEGPAASTENIAVEFEQMNVAAAMPPTEHFDSGTTITGSHSAPAQVTRADRALIVENLRLALLRPVDLRTALVAMEVLGKPKALQN